MYRSYRRLADRGRGRVDCERRLHKAIAANISKYTFLYVLHSTPYCTCCTCWPRPAWSWRRSPGRSTRTRPWRRSARRQCWLAGRGCRR